VLANVDPNANWIAVTEGHTMRRLKSLTFVSCNATVDMTGVDALVSGDFQAGAVTQDGLCDITDFSMLARDFNTAIDPTISSGADATADGVQGSADFAAIQMNFLTAGDAVNGCGTLRRDGRLTEFDLMNPADVVRPMPKSAIAVQALPMNNANRADLNRDGIVNYQDIREFAKIHGLRLIPSFERKLSQLERAKVGRQRR
jgi:hypothetical protein